MRVARWPGAAHAEGETLVLQILFCHLASDRVEVFRGLLRRDAWLEAAEEDEAAVIAAAEVVPAGDLLGVDDGDPVVRREEVVGAVKVFAGDTEDGEGMLTEQDGAADDARVAGELATPEVVAEHDVGGRAEAVFVRGMEEASERGLQAEHIEVVAGGGDAPGLRDRLIQGDADAENLVGQ